MTKPWLAPMCLLSLIATTACDSEPESVIGLQLETGQEPRRFSVDSAFAEYVELPGVANELRITLASYDASCERFVPPEQDDVSVTVTITMPAGQPVAPGRYTWAGHEAHGGTADSPARPYAFPSARVGSKSYLFQPGGSVDLKAVRLDRHGGLDGLLAFEFPGDAEHAATGIRGRFFAKFCRFNPAARQN